MLLGGVLVEFGIFGRYHSHQTARAPQSNQKVKRRQGQKIQGRRAHVPSRLSWLNSAFSADIAPIRLADPVNPIKKVKKRQGSEIHGNGAGE
jgi:hypothetical protein